jgi:glyoxylase-like metal-dependent hydrolase (beta-lactamase superfamily II)
MPYIVVNTHLGPDHSFGNIQYDRVYCHEYEVDNIRGRVKPGMFDYLFDQAGEPLWLQFDRSDLPPYRDYELIGVPDGYVFNLGEDYDVELIWTGGHAAGHAMFLDKKGRNLFAGDDVCSDIIGCGSGPREGMFYNQYRNVQTYRDNLARLVKRLDEIDYLFPGHFMVNLESHLLLDILDTLNAIVADPENYDYAEEHISGNRQGENSLRMHKFVKGFGTVAYTKNGVYPP